MGEESSEIQSDTDKAPPENKQPRIVKRLKTHSQVQALETFYNEHKYPTESMKVQLAESIGLTEKQVSGWFCHRRLKDKRSMNGENHAIGKLDKSGGTVQDRGSGQRQDSCGSTKQGNNKNFDTREVESERFSPKEISATNLRHEHGSHSAENYDQKNDPSSGSSSSLRSKSNQQIGDVFDAPTTSYTVPRFQTEMKSGKIRSGPSGYLKVKGRSENPVVTAVKRQLGKHYRDDGPPLGVEFDPLPPGTFESFMQDAAEEYDVGEVARPASADVTEICRTNPKVIERYEYNKSSAASNDSNIDRTSFITRRGSESPNTYFHQNSRLRTLSDGNAYNPRRMSSLKSPGNPDRCIPVSENRDEYETKPGTVSVSSHPHLQSYSQKVRGEQTEPPFHKHNDANAMNAFGADFGNEYSNLTMKRKEYHKSARRFIEDSEMYNDRTVDESRFKVPFYNIPTVPKRIWKEFPQHQRYFAMEDRLPHTYNVVRLTAMKSSHSEDRGSAETS